MFEILCIKFKICPSGKVLYCAQTVFTKFYFIVHFKWPQYLSNKASDALELRLCLNSQKLAGFIVFSNTAICYGMTEYSYSVYEEILHRQTYYTVGDVK